MAREVIGLCKCEGYDAFLVKAWRVVEVSKLLMLRLEGVR